LSFITDREGWLATECSAVGILHTVDAGATWERLGSDGIVGGRCVAPSFADPNHGFLSASDQNNHPLIYRTSDGGRTWAASDRFRNPPGYTEQPGGYGLQAGLVRAFGTALLVPVSGDQAGSSVDYVYRSTDGGATWSYLATDRNQGGTLALVTASRWIQIIAPGQSVETTDGGATWHPYASDYTQAAPVAPIVMFADDQVGYLTVRGEIQVTHDGGVHWTYLKTPGT
jgi:photosystem II stability/assembly factor-like uncharacterized protein